MYAKGMSIRDISDIVKGVYGFDISAEMVSNITDRVVDDLAERQNRPLKAMDSFMFVDCMHVNVKRERRSEKHAVYVALAYDLDGHKDVLDLWAGESEGKHFWMGVFDELHRRGIRRISTISETSRPRRNIRPIDAAKKKEGRTPLLLDSLYPGCLPASSPSPKPSGRYGVEPLRMENSIAAMPAMRVTHTTPSVRFTSRG